MSCQLNFLTILSLLELDSEAAPSCFRYFLLYKNDFCLILRLFNFFQKVPKKAPGELIANFLKMNQYIINKMELLQSQAPAERELLGNSAGH